MSEKNLSSILSKIILIISKNIRKTGLNVIEYFN